MEYANMRERLLANSVRADLLGLRECQHEGSACWLWLGSIAVNGYGRLNVRADGNKHTQVLAHRAAYEAFVGPIPEGLTIDHKCNFRSCIAPLHLDAVTHGENIARREQRRRGAQ